MSGSHGLVEGKLPMSRKEIIAPASLPRPRMGYSPVVRAGPFAYVSGQVASDFKTGIPAEAGINPAFPLHGSRIERQTAFIAKNLEAALEAAGSSLANCLFMGVYQTDAAEVHGASRMLQQAFGTAGVPPHTTVVLEELPVPGCTLEIDAIGFVPRNGEQLRRLNPSSLPRPVIAGLDDDPLFQYGVRAGPYVFTAGITATDFSSAVAPAALLDPNFIYYAESGTLQAEYILERLAEILREGGASMADVVKADLYLTDLHDFYRVERVWKRWFPHEPPARVTVPVSHLGVPGLRVAIDLVAFIPEDGQIRRTIHTDAAPTPTTHEPQAVQAGDLLFFSGLMATDYRTGVPARARVDPSFPYFGSGAERQVQYIIDNVDAICAAAGIGREHLVRRRGLYADFSEFFTSFTTWAESFPREPPASTTVRVPGPLLVPGCEFVLDLMGIIPD